MKIGAIICLLFLLVIGTALGGEASFNCPDGYGICPDGKSCFYNGYDMNNSTTQQSHNDTKKEGDDEGMAFVQYLVSELSFCECTVMGFFEQVMGVFNIMSQMNESATYEFVDENCFCRNETTWNNVYEAKIKPALLEKFTTNPNCTCFNTTSMEQLNDITRLKVLNESDCECRDMDNFWNKMHNYTTGTCECGNGTFWCFTKKRCIPTNEYCPRIGEDYFSCFANEFVCHTTQGNKCAKTDKECKCYQEGYPDICYKYDQTTNTSISYCTFDAKKCGDILDQCPSDKPVRCSNGMCQNDWKSCDCAKYNGTYCSVLGSCIPYGSTCESKCNSKDQGYFYCKSPTGNFETCSHSSDDCYCKLQLNNPSAIKCYINGKCESSPDNCKQEQDYCKPMGLVTCKNQSLSSQEFYKRKDEDIRNHPKFRAVVDAANLTCSCTEEVAAVELSTYFENGGPNSTCWCQNATSFENFLGELKMKMLDNKTCGCTDVGTDQFINSFRIMADQLNVSTECECVNRTYLEIKNNHMYREMIDNANLECNCTEDSSLKFMTEYFETNKEEKDSEKCWCKNATTVGQFANELKERMLGDEYCGCRGVGTQKLIDSFLQYTNNITSDCKCMKNETHNNHHDDKNSYDEDRHPYVICGVSEDLCDICANQGLLSCPNGKCSEKYSDCFKQERESCSSYDQTLIDCPENSVQICAKTIEDCQRTLECPTYFQQWVKCKGYNGCYPNYNLCPQDACTMKNLLKCPTAANTNFAQCVEDLRMCNKTCTYPNPILCRNGNCVQYDWECEMATCADDEMRCSDKTCVKKATERCCLEGEEFRCHIDNKCYKNHEGYLCSVDNKCGNAGEMPCPNNSSKCVDATQPELCYLPECQENQVRCEDGSCRAKELADSVGCTCKGVSGQKYCPNIDMCITTEKFDGCFECSKGFIKCENTGKCVENEKMCTSTVQCPLGEGLCSSGRCVKDYFACNQNNCPNVCSDGRCVENPAFCCGVGTTLCGMGDNKGKCIQDSQFATECTDANFVICPSNKPFLCWQNNTCMADSTNCPCPMENGVQLHKCDDGDCVIDVETQCISNKKDLYCSGGVMCDDGTCSKTESDCASIASIPAGYVKCPNGIDFIPSTEDISKCPTSTVCPSSTPIFCKVNKECVNDITKCPSSVWCGSKKLCWDGITCKDDIANCPIPIPCQPDEIRCTIGGECKKELSLCPKGIVCGNDEKRCPGDFCVANTKTCPVLEECVNKVRCSNGQCAENYDLCPNIKTCPEGMIKCGNGMCKKDQSECSSGTECQSGTVECPGYPGICQESLSKCPTAISCPGSKFLCWNNECVDKSTDCKTYTDCAPGQKRCSNGIDCVWEGEKCPQDIICPIDFPILCGGQCVKDKSRCMTIDCPSTHHICSTGECVENQIYCPSKTVCKDNEILCWDQFSCRTNLEDCPQKIEKICSGEFPFLCKDNNCYRSSSDCPSIFTCPQEKPINCNGFCYETEEECEEMKKKYDFRCENNEFLCPDARTCSINGTCPSMVVCTKDLPFRCPDGQCRKDESFCGEIKECNWETEKICWDSSCVLKNANCPDHVSCNEGFILCPDYTCKNSSDSCSSDFDCPPNQIFCSANLKCMNSESECNTLLNIDCPESAPIKCLDGSCKKTQSECFDISTGCQQGWIKCRKDGSCRKTQSECDGATAINCAAKGLTQCLDGTCRLDCSNILANGCPNNLPKLCADMTCIGENELCSSNLFCPGKKKRCEGGLCVDINEVCPLPSYAQMVQCLRNEEGKHYPCANGKCVKDENECPIIIPCDGATPYKCPNGMCIANITWCEDGDSGCPLDLPIRCESGICAKTDDHCPLPNGCPKKNPISCETGSYGKCVTNEVDCGYGDNEYLANGCKATLPIRCEHSDQCVTSEDQCLLANGCNNNAPIRCSNGMCADSISSCSNSTSCQYFTCPNGLCVYNRDDCLSKDGCPLNTPIRCKTGECVKQSKQCPSVVRCLDPSKPFKCFSGKCVASKNLCVPVESCESGYERCLNGQCKLIGTCRTDICPSESPIRCPDSGECVSSAFYCKNSKEIECLDQNLFYCDITDECTTSAFDCFKDLSSCDTGFSRCPTSECIDNLENCEEIKMCPVSKPVRCEDGSCGASKAYCEGLGVTACSNTEKRCKDGRCVDKNTGICPPVGGCPPLMWTCPNLTCSETLEGCQNENNKYICHDGSIKTGFEECKRPEKMMPISLTTGNSKLEIPLLDNSGNSLELGIIEIPPFSFNSDDNTTLAQSDSSGNIRVSSGDESLFQKALLSGANKTANKDGEDEFIVDLCSVIISIKALNQDGTERAGVDLFEPTKLCFLNKCTGKENSTLYLGSINEITGEIIKESNVSILTKGNETFICGFTTHYSSFSLTNFIAQVKDEDLTPLEIILEFPMWAITLIVVFVILIIIFVFAVIISILFGAGCCIYKFLRKGEVQTVQPIGKEFEIACDVTPKDQ